jgi:ABC-type multidrug transport system ATPase subunit
MSDTVLEIKNLRKVYKDVVALDDLSFEVKKGQVFGLLGPNGSGKTTTLGILLGVLRQNQGTFSWFNNGDKDENRKNIGALLETPNFYPYLSAFDNLVVVAKIKGMTDYAERIDEVLKRVNLFERKKSKFKTFSLGMKQRLAIASAMLNDPEVLVLDEPTNGLDPEGIAEIRDLIKEIALSGKTIVIASHILDEIEKVCTHVAIMRKGKLLQMGELAEVMTQERLLLLKSADLNELKNAIERLSHAKFIKIKEDEVLVSIADDFDPAVLNKELAGLGIYLSSIKEHRKNLESMFLEIIKA